MAQWILLPTGGRFLVPGGSPPMSWTPSQESTKEVTPAVRERTPELFLEEPLPDAREPDSGCMAACYICGNSLIAYRNGAPVPEEQIDRRYRQYREGTAREPGKLRSYVISYCRLCAWSHLDRV